MLKYHIFEGTTGSCQNPIGRHPEKERSKIYTTNNETKKKEKII
jgi:hypothetical protein